MQRHRARRRHAVAVRDDADGLEDAVAALERDVPDAAFERCRGRRHAVQGCKGAAVPAEAAERPECHLPVLRGGASTGVSARASIYANEGARPQRYSTLVETRAAPLHTIALKL